MKKFKEILKKDIDSDADFIRALEGPDGVFVIDAVDARMMKFDSMATAKNLLAHNYDTFYGKDIYPALSLEVKEEMLSHEDFIEIKNKVKNFPKATITAKEVSDVREMANRSLRRIALSDLLSARSVRVW